MWGRKKRARAQDDQPPAPSYWAGAQPAQGPPRTVTMSRIVVNGKEVDPSSPEGQEALRLAKLVQEDTAPTAAGGALDERYTELERVAQLHASGALTDEEFEAEKRRILG